MGISENRENYFLQNIFYNYYLHKNTMIQKHPNPASRWDAFNSNPRLYELLLCSETKLTFKSFTPRQISFNFKVRVRKTKNHHFNFFCSVWDCDMETYYYWNDNTLVWIILSNLSQVCVSLRVYAYVYAFIHMSIYVSIWTFIQICVHSFLCWCSCLNCAFMQLL